MAEERETSDTPTDPALPPIDSNIRHADSLAYWASIPPTVDGMLGGFPQVSRIDLRGSLNFLTKLRKSSPNPSKPFTRAVDCGAGIGRITAGLLSKVCTTIDIVEPIAKFAAEVPNAEFQGNGLVGDVYVTGLERWEPREGVKYDLIWNQWALGHLTDGQLVAHLKKCRRLLEEGGWIIVKENMSTEPDGTDVFDETDSSVSRAHTTFQRIFGEAGLRIVGAEVQAGFPRELLPVRTYALRPMD